MGQYKEPLGGHPTLVSILPIGKIDPTPFQRDLSDTQTTNDQLISQRTRGAKIGD